MPRSVVLLVVLLTAAVAPAKELPAGRADFDLSLLTRPPDNGLVCVRPAELAVLAGDTDEAVGGVVAQFAKAVAAFIDGELKVEDLPAAADLEQVVLGLNLSLTLSTQKEQGTLSLTGTNFGYLCTKGKFDWAGLIKKTFPKAQTKTHAGREYLTAGVKFSGFEFTLGFYTPDERTLVFDQNAEKMVAALGEWGKLVPTMPAGWDEVKGCSLAFVALMGNRKWMITPAGKLSEPGKQVKKLVKGLKSVCVGVTLGDTATAVGVFTATSDDAARTVQGILNDSFTAYEASLGKRLAGTLAATATRQGKAVRVDGFAKVNILREYLKASEDKK
ncbi:MAG: hypothetical protein MUF18_03955 [Fimbriiglobus sp.]|nr:hypothetical protein [Fimbriiglobus sp.]